MFSDMQSLVIWKGGTAPNATGRRGAPAPSRLCVSVISATIASTQPESHPQGVLPMGSCRLCPPYRGTGGLVCRGSVQALRNALRCHAVGSFSRHMLCTTQGAGPPQGRERVELGQPHGRVFCHRSGRVNGLQFEVTSQWMDRQERERERVADRGGASQAGGGARGPAQHASGSPR